MNVEVAPLSGKTHSRAVLASSLAALGSVLAASSCCLPILPFVAAAGIAGSSSLFTAVRPYLLVASVLLIAFGFYQRRRATQCACKPSIVNAVVLWTSALLVAVSILFPQLLANLVANLK